ncbi:MAG: DUF429 domain-containing protein [Cyanobacteria bacterium J06638_22]
MMAMIFIGVDLGWTSQPTGLCCLRSHYIADRLELQLVELTRIDSLESVLAWIDRQCPATQMGGIAVDAPTLIRNETGMRMCDRFAHRYFGRYHAGCYPANLGLPFAQRTVGFGLALEQRGFCHAPSLQPQQPTRFQVEVFPHPATIRLFRLPRILKYKKGRVSDRHIALSQFRQHILDSLPSANPSLSITEDDLPTIPKTGVAMKAVEDQLDSLICAYVAAHWWAWGQERNQILGDGETGYIVVPNPDRLLLD